MIKTENARDSNIHSHDIIIGEKPFLIAIFYRRK